MKTEFKKAYVLINDFDLFWEKLPKWTVFKYYSDKDFYTPTVVEWWFLMQKVNCRLHFTLMNPDYFIEIFI